MNGRMNSCDRNDSALRARVWRAFVTASEFSFTGEVLRRDIEVYRQSFADGKKWREATPLASLLERPVGQTFLEIELIRKN